MRNLWNESIPFPTFEEMEKIEGARYLSVHTAEENGYHFALGAAVIKHKGILRVSFANSWRNENDGNTVLAEKCLADGDTAWKSGFIAQNANGYGRSHGVYFKKDGKLYVFCPSARYDRIDCYPDLKMEAYQEDGNGHFTCLGTVLDKDFWPMCEPIMLKDGTLLMGGLKTNDASAAVALCRGDDLTKWEMRIIPNPNGYSYWGETTVIACPDRLLALVRGGTGTTNILVSESKDNGKSWSGLVESNFPIAHSKMYAGVLSNGLRYLVFSVRDRGYRDTLAIAIGQSSFEKIYVIRDGFDAPAKFFINEWSYPYAYEDVEQGILYVAYTKNKEDCELICIPISSFCLERKREQQ